MRRKLHAAADCPTKDPAGLGRVVMATEQKEITTSPWLRHRLPEPFYSQNRVSPGHMIRVSGHSS